MDDLAYNGDGVEELETFTAGGRRTRASRVVMTSQDIALGANPDTLRRAIAFIEAHPDVDLALPDIARAACVTPRALQLAFRRRLDTTPMAYLRRIRLERARRDLSAAAPGDGTSVTTVAYRWGFSTPSRFSQHYRAAYGESPSQTLRSGDGAG